MYAGSMNASTPASSGKAPTEIFRIRPKPQQGAASAAGRWLGADAVLTIRGKDKTIVMGILERGGAVRTHVVSDRKKKTLQKQVKKHVQAGSALYTDALRSYDGLAKDYAHNMIDHAVQYVDGRVHTNGMENFWSLLKRGISGTYISVEPFHLFRYLDEQAFRFNNRKLLSDGDRFSIVTSRIDGKRLTYKQLTGKTVSEEEAARQV